MSDSTDFDLPPVPIDPPGFQIRFRPPHELRDRVTPESDLFLIAHLGVARIDAASWRLTIGGLVERPCEFTFDDIQRLPKRHVESCTNDVKGLCRLALTDRRAGSVFATTLYNDPDEDTPGKTVRCGRRPRNR